MCKEIQIPQRHGSAEKMRVTVGSFILTPLTQNHCGTLHFCGSESPDENIQHSSDGSQIIPCASVVISSHSDSYCSKILIDFIKLLHYLHLLFVLIHQQRITYALESLTIFY